MESFAVSSTLSSGVPFTLGVQVGMFPAPIVIFGLVSAILLCIVSLLQDLIRPRVRFSLAQLFVVTAVFVLMFGGAVHFWRML